MQAEFFRQSHVDGNIGGGRAGEKRVYAAFTQTGQHQRIRIFLNFPPNNQRIEYECDKQHTAHQHHEEAEIVF